MIEDRFPWQEERELGAFPSLSKGIDSNVYRLGEWVAKEYQHLSIGEVQRYARFQNRARDVLARKPYKTSITFKGAATELVAERAVPVSWVGLSASGKPLTYSRFVEATNLEKLLWRPEKFEAYKKAEMTDSGLCSFASEMNAFFWNEYPTRVQDEFHYHVCMLSRRLDSELGTSGLYISKYNVKLEPDLARGRINLIVTDLALYIERVEFPAESS